jgi:tryptophan-rich sensory protein
MLPLKLAAFFVSTYNVSYSFTPKKEFVMGNLLYLVAVVLVIIWAISFFGGFYTGGIIHILLVIAIVAILLRVIRGAA